MEPLFLSKEEIAELTGYKIPALQCRWLKEKGWIFERNNNGRAIVGRAYANTRLGAADLSQCMHGSSTARPNFAALRSR